MTKRPGTVRLYVLRHGQTAWNAVGRYQGETDVPLDEVGRGQAVRLRPRLAQGRFAAVYSSTLCRAHDTAAIALPTREEQIVRLAGLNEMSYGLWETHTREEIAQLFPENWRAYHERPEAERPAGGENRGEFHQRVIGTLHGLVQGHQGGETVVVASHGGTLRAMVTQLLGLPLEAYRRFHFDNAALSVFDVPRPAAESHPANLRGTVVLLNDTAHLEPLKTRPEDRAV